ncbi:REP-associated tyrosine transposase [Alloalcanivorax mobilis]|uniref:REP-associated tyrosine transposase n=1 Tax=Alloalcanivorax mobilis TaxID=2019569 RepID=UPI000B5B3E2A|nr:transposase [Alloalcanivorax mobilis]ASK33621.1 transposase [Alcanivorax sp. N3-2A]|tara:strand:+ start:3235 stop:3690 length:456 start_codon:yes stop_codon:yes gene_type:complete
MPWTARTHRLRLGRHSQAGGIYLITITCQQRQPAFTTLGQGRCFVRAIRTVSNQADTLCYVVMPDHVHWLMQLRPGNDLCEVVRKAKSLTTRRWRRLRPDAGGLWQSGFHDRALRKDEDLAAAARYIIANPLRAGLTGSVRDYSLWDALWL